MTRLRDPRNGPAFDTSTEAVPERRYVVAATPRTGSTLLCRALWDLGLGAPKEVLNPPAVRDWEVRLGRPAARLGHAALRGPLVGLAGRGRWGDDRLRAYLDRVAARRTAGGWFGLKLHGHHLARWFLAAGRDPVTWLAPQVWIRVRRRDRVAQAASWARARQTGQWAAGRRPWAPPVYRRRAIDRGLRWIAEGEAAWDEVLGDREVVEVAYEDLVADWAGTVGRVAVALGGSPTGVPEPALRRQGEAAAWAARWRGSIDPDGPPSPPV